MKQLLFLTILILCLSSCKTNNKKTWGDTTFQIILTDTTNNHRAKWDLDDFNYRLKLENQLGLTNLKNGSDSLEIRLWHDYSFSAVQDLYTLKFINTSCLVSYFRVYSKERNGIPYVDPIIDSSFSKTICVSKTKFQNLNLDSFWLLKSQSDLKISDSIGFTDCDSYIVEIADKRRLKYLRHHCSAGYYKKTTLKAISDFEDFCGRIVLLARDNNAYVQEKFDD